MAVLDVPRPDFLDEEEIRMFEDSARRFFEEHAPPEVTASWRRNGVVDRDMWTKAGAAGLLCLSVPEQYGGMGATLNEQIIMTEELARVGAPHLPVQGLNHIGPI